MKTTRIFLLSLLLSLPWAAGADTTGQQIQFLDMLDRYLAISDEVTRIAGQPNRVSYIAVEGIVEIHEMRGNAAQAIPELEKLLKETRNNQTLRNILHLKLRDLYKDSAQGEKALQHLRAILRENRAGR